MSDQGIEIQMDEILKTFDVKLNAAVEKVTKQVAQETAKQLRSTSPKNTGEYASGWTVKKEPGEMGSTGYVVYNSKKPWRTHLLEFGHEKKNQHGSYGRVAAHPHIKPAEEAAKAKLESLLVDEINKG